MHCKLVDPLQTALPVRGPPSYCTVCLSVATSLHSIPLPWNPFLITSLVLKRHEVVLELQRFHEQWDLWFTLSPQLPNSALLPAINQVRTKVKSSQGYAMPPLMCHPLTCQPPNDMPLTDMAPPLMCHPPTDMPAPLMCHPPLCMAMVTAKYIGLWGQISSSLLSCLGTRAGADIYI